MNYIFVCVTLILSRYQKGNDRTRGTDADKGDWAALFTRAHEISEGFIDGRFFRSDLVYLKISGRSKYAVASIYGYIYFN